MAPPVSPPRPARRPNAFARRAAVAADAVAAAAALATLAGLAGRRWPLLDLATHFRLHGLIGLTPGLTLALARRRRRWALALGLPWLVSAASVGRAGWPDAASVSDADAAADGLDLTVFNVWGLNPTPQRIGRYLEARGGDVVVVVELRPPLVRRLAAELPSYTPAALAPRDDFYGVGVYVRHDAAARGITVADARAEILVAGDAAQRPCIVATLAFGGRAAALLAAHPPPPKGAAMTRERDRAMAAAAARLTATGRPGLLCGDVNAGPASTGRAAARAVGLRDVTRGHGYRGTWPAFLPPWLGIPIDVCLADAAIHATAVAVGPALGSDHRPLHVRLRWR